MRYAIYVHNPEGDMGYGQIIGPFRSWDAACAKHDQLVADESIEAILLPCFEGQKAKRDIIREVAHA